MFKICSRSWRLRAARLVLSGLTCATMALAAMNSAAIAGPDGVVHVIDGDTLDVGSVRVRLLGIDAPEVDQHCGGNGVPMWPCGAWVSDHVTARFEGRLARCTRHDTDRYGRIVASCEVDGVDIGRTLVQEGLAFAYRKYSMAYDLDEKIAVLQDAGLHGAGVASPETHRASARAGRAAVNLAAAPQGCAIKGNISGNGHIYHMPGQAWYDRTRISDARGERWFCSEAEAQAAGWRRARR